MTKVRREYDCNDAKSIFLAADSFYAIYDFAKHTADLMSETNDTAYVHNMISASLTNHALACELYLKCISCIQKNKYLHGHDLLSLFEHLNKSNQEKITKMYLQLCTSELALITSSYLGKIEPDDIKTLLQDGKTAFIDLRYIFENRVRNYNLHFVVIALRNIIIENKPEWPRLLRLY